MPQPQFEEGGQVIAARSETGKPLRRPGRPQGISHHHYATQLLQYTPAVFRERTPGKGNGGSSDEWIATGIRWSSGSIGIPSIVPRRKVAEFFLETATPVGGTVGDGYLEFTMRTCVVEDEEDF